jgi:molybdate transport system ATP-binding protein
VENLLRLRVLDVSPEEGVMRCGHDGFLLEVPLADAQVGEEIAVGIWADDILLASARPEGLSAGNMLHGTIVSVQPHGPVYEVALDCGMRLVSHVTSRAVQALGIAPGANAWAVVKTSSCHLFRD